MPTDRIEEIITRVVQREAGYVDHPSDHGGPTNWGISVAIARQAGWQGSMRDLPESFARDVYRRRFVYTPAFDKIAAVSIPVGEELVDTGVNMGPGIASVFFQRWLNGFNLRGRKYADLFVDGRIGPATVMSFNAYIDFRGQEGVDVMVAALNAVQGNRYLEIVENNVTQEDFLYGWIRTRVLGLP